MAAVPENSYFNRPFHNTTTPNRKSTSSFYSSRSVRVSKEGHHSNESAYSSEPKFDIIMSLLSEQKQSLAQHQEQNDSVLNIIHQLVSNVSSLKEDIDDLKIQLNQVKTAATSVGSAKKKVQIPRNVSVSFFLF